MQREEFMRELTREPVVLHWKGGGGGGNGDIHLRGAQMDINGLALLDDCNLTLVSGRKYGLVGRNGIGKTTLLKFLAAHRFEGMPPQLQVLHIEQEVAGGELSVLETVLATDIERNALLAEQAELEAVTAALDPLEVRWLNPVSIKGEVGMAARPESRFALESAGLKFVEPDE